MSNTKFPSLAGFLVAALATLVSTTAPRCETIELEIHSYCSPGTFCGAKYECPPGTPCDVTSWEDYRRLILESVQEMNLQWEGTGISFHPKVHPIDSSKPNYHLVTGCGDNSPANPRICDDFATSCTQDSDCAGIGSGACSLLKVCKDLATVCSDDSECNPPGDRCLVMNKQRRLRWREEVAAQNPSALHMMITGGPEKCCSHIPNYHPSEPPCLGGDPDDGVNVLGIFCDPGRAEYHNGSIWAHEMGHHWCLHHTFTGDDVADIIPPDTPQWNPDFQCGVEDTPDDPAPFEGYKVGSEKRDESWTCYDGTACVVDEDCTGIGGGTCVPPPLLIDDHQWCFGLKVADVDPGSPHPTRCIAACRQRVDGNTVPLFFPTDPDVGAALSYHEHYCRGPWVRNGWTYRSFSPFSMSVIQECRQNNPGRSSLPDVCAGKGGDGDHDGICDAEDNCDLHRNTAQRDRDGDGLGDACDNCPDVPIPSPDTDGDGLGDACDANIDGDACDNDVDQHPFQGEVAIGTRYNPACNLGTERVYGSESDDSDMDGVPNCLDVDDDDDQICDEGGPLDPADNPPGAPAGCDVSPVGLDVCPTQAGEGCLNQPFPGVCPPDWNLCQGPGCLDFFLKLHLVSDPDPASGIVFDKFQILNETIYASAAAGTTLSESARLIEGIVLPSPGEAAGDPLRLEIWSRATNQPVAVVAGYDAGDVALGEITHGVVLAITPDPTRTGAPLAVEATFLRAPHPDQPDLDDRDADLWPDPFDNCIDTPNPGQYDADGDGFGNACDADLDGDMLTTQADLDAIAACQGADLTLSFPISEPVDIGGFGFDEAPDPQAFDLSLACRAADLDESWLVDASDTSAASRLLGLPPGPSAYLAPVDLCGASPNCDDGDACTFDRCVPATGQCVHELRVCDDADPCTLDSCDPATGACLASLNSCDDGNSCTSDSCDPFAGCVHSPLRDGDPCDDGSVCTSAGTCAAGTCEAPPIIVCDDRDPCTVDVCDAVTGACSAEPVVCDDGDPCTDDLCDPSSGQCITAPATVGEAGPISFVSSTTLVWDDDLLPGHWNTYRGTIPATTLGSRLPDGVFDHVCYESADFVGDGRTTSTDWSTPPPGGAYYYLISRETLCLEGSLGTDPAGNVRPNLDPCITPP